MENHVERYPTAVAYWRRASVDAVLDGASQRYTVGSGLNWLKRISSWAAAAQVQQRDSAMMALLKRYAPDAKQLKNYPG